MDPSHGNAIINYFYLFTLKYIIMLYIGIIRLVGDILSNNEFVNIFD
jgi:hypothetical protein